MMMHDVGLTFGRGNLFNRTSVGSVNFDQWSKTPVWKNAQACIGNLSKSATGTLNDPLISEAGRKFLADLLVQLSDSQLTIYRHRGRQPAQPSAESRRSAREHRRVGRRIQP